MTVYHLLQWFYNKKQAKSIADLNTLLKKVLLPEDFSQDHLEGFSMQKVLKDVGNYGGVRYDLQADYGWIETSIKIPVPCTGVKQSEADTPAYELKGVFYCKPLEIIKSVFQSEQAKKFHYTLFKLCQQQSFPDKRDLCLYSELYNTDAFIEEHAKIQRQQKKRRLDDPEDPSLHVPCTIAGMMLWSDATKIGTWGNQSMWPIYLYFRNQSKYDRAKLSAFTSHHMAYIPKLPNNFHDFYKEHYNTAPTEAVLTNVQREILQSIYGLIFDNEFMEAYDHGLVLKCANIVQRCLFPCLFTYSVDYIEKILIATICMLGSHPCVHCLVDKDQIDQLGTKSDTKRCERKACIDSEEHQSTIEKMWKWIFDDGLSVASSYVEAFSNLLLGLLLKYVIHNIFKLFGMNFYDLLVPDVLLELELGIWKAILLHLICMVHCLGSENIQEMNGRYNYISVDICLAHFVSGFKTYQCLEGAQFGKFAKMFWT
ncbi:hypothetical protein BT96DRAFT_841397 [Gymnopus androsaceus JB14]|uniref:Uncharacterized protein n=1 Tax=Gymnopus androsaceus JB14 TaxID=1447944 RepID=A0A6A4GHU7_9AGAR|nr:hypothetical protein BT96DRAFT_841397 [Gymnopus androsaceus JB14]